MRIVIVGYGRMGHEIERVAAARGHKIIATVDPVAEDATARSVAEAAAGPLPSTAADPVVAIDFALPEAVKDNVAAYRDAGWAVVVGTTGWDQQREEILLPAREGDIALVYGSNFSVGANMFIRIARHAARLAERTGEYDGAVFELHHRGKQDSPSGTALMIADAIQAEMTDKQQIQTETLHRRISPEELHVASGRVGSIPGTHTVYLDSTADTVELTHRARSRQGFAVGAVQAAEWIASRSGIHPVEAFFDDLFSGS
jgi:4-hydroxy-tetrahydrodipicolinate reductase